MKNNLMLKIDCSGGQMIKLEITERDGVKRKRKVKTWSSEEDDLLIKLYQKYPKKWSCISSLMNQRNENQCLHRYRRLSQLGRQRKIWSEEEDETIKKLIKKVGKNWKFLSEMLGTKTGKQIRERYINKLDPRIKKEEWTEEQDLRLIHLYSEFGSRWSQIAKKLPGRPQNRIKNRFYSYIKRNYQIKQTIVKVSEQKPQEEQHQTAHFHPHPIEVPKEPLSVNHKLMNSTNSIGFGSDNMLHKFPVSREDQQQKLVGHSKLLLEGTELLIREFKHPQQLSNRGINITSFTNFPEDDLIHYLDSKNTRIDSLRFLDTF